MKTALKKLSLLRIIIALVTLVMLSVTIPSLIYNIVVERAEIEASAERQAIAALDMLESVHVQAMLNRGKTNDGDPAIATLNGTMEQFSDTHHSVKLWVFMGKKVVDFQKSNGETEIEAPQDVLDQQVAQSLQVKSNFTNDVFRLSRPVILGQGHATDQRCAACHTGLMDIHQGELIGGYSAAVDVRPQFSDWYYGAIRQILAALLILICTIAAIYFLLRLVALRPLVHLSQITASLSNGDTDVSIDLADRKDALGTMARSLQKFRDSLLDKKRAEVERDNAHKKLQYLASHDTLTGLPNRAKFTQKVSDVLTLMGKDGRQIAVMCIDVDHFKTVNDTLGHGAGDTILQIVAERLRDAVGQHGTAARYGGDEFAAVFHTVHELEQICENISTAFAEPVHLNENKFLLTISFGVAIGPTDGETAHQLMNNADAALYSAKAEGRNTYRFYRAEMNAGLQERRAIENDLRVAFSEDRLELHYQPLIDSFSGEITGVESLMRWHHPEKGWISPATFIPIAEACGLIQPIGKWLIRKACQQASCWPNLTIAINISPAQFNDDGLVDFVACVLEETGLEGARLEIEITEGLIMDDRHKPLEKLRALRALGVKIAMDDFGTGYSSLGSLQSFPFDKIKIDQSFVMRLGQDENAGAIIRAVIGLGRSLGMTITAEGVETLEQLSFLQSEGCDQLQGYYLARPQSPLNISTLLGAWQTKHAIVKLLNVAAS